MSMRTTIYCNDETQAKLDELMELAAKEPAHWSQITGKAAPTNFNQLIAALVDLGYHVLASGSAEYEIKAGSSKRLRERHEELVRDVPDEAGEKAADGPSTTAGAHYPHIEFIEGGVPVIAGTRFKVLQIALDHIAFAWDADLIQRQHPCLTLAQVHAALTYYFDHQAEMDEEIEARIRRAEEIEARLGPSPLKAKLRAMRAAR